MDQQNLEKQQEQTTTGGRCFILVRQLKLGWKCLFNGLFFLHECDFPSLNLIQSGKPELQSMEGTLERKHKLQLGGKKVRRVWAHAVSKQEAPTQHSYLVFTGSLQRMELLPHYPPQTHLVLLPGPKRHAASEHQDVRNLLWKYVEMWLNEHFVSAELCVWTSLKPDWSRVHTRPRIHQKTQLLSITVRTEELIKCKMKNKKCH